MKTEGVEKRWHENGQLSHTKFWKDGFEDQKEEKFYSDGQPQYSALWSNGRKIEEKKFNNQGKLLYHCVWNESGGIKSEHKFD